MVRQELLDAYERLNDRRKLYIKATKYGRYICWIGVALIILSILFIVTGFVVYNNRTWFLVCFGGFYLGLVLFVVGIKIIKDKEDLAPFSRHESAFLKVVDSLKSIETLQKDGAEYARIEAIKKLSDVEKRIKEPQFENYPLWEELTKEANENLRYLKRNLREKIIPMITQSNDEDLKRAYVYIEEVAKYVLNPVISELKDLNFLMSETAPYIKQKSSPLLFINQYPNIRHACLIIVFGFCGFLVYYLGVKFANTSPDTAYLAGVTLFVGLIGGYVLIVKEKPTSSR